MSLIPFFFQFIFSEAHPYDDNNQQFVNSMKLFSNYSTWNPDVRQKKKNVFCYILVNILTYSSLLISEFGIN